MTPFRRCGLAEDDEIGTSPVTLRYRHQNNSTSTCGSCSETTTSGDEIVWEEEDESVVSAMTTTSDLESVYNETSSQFRTLNLRERFLLQHRLPQPSRTVSMVLSEHERRALISKAVSPSTSTNDMEDDNESCDCDAMDNPLLLQQEQPESQPWQMVHPPKVFSDPHEKAIGGAIAGIRNEFEDWFDREGIQLSQIVESDEESSQLSS